MPIGPKKRPANVIGNAVRMMQVATGETEEEVVDLAKRPGGQKGGKARASATSTPALTCATT